MGDQLVLKCYNIVSYQDEQYSKNVTCTVS